MYKYSMPICLRSVNEENMQTYLEMLKNAKAERVFIYGVGYPYLKNIKLHNETQSIKNIIRFFKENGLEVGVWIDGLGHGGGPIPEFKEDMEKYTKIRGIDGKCAPHALCPSDKNFVIDYANGIKTIASLDPDIIMIDDDFRINGRGSYYLGCFCDYHYKRYQEILGEEVELKDIERLITTGENNKYRTAYFDMVKETLLNFALTMRNTLNEVNPKIRLGVSSSLESWDLSGTTVIELAKAFAGNTKPFTRIAGAPYWSSNIIGVTECARQQFAYAHSSGVEIFAEGDTYPRPRYNYNSSSKQLELFDLMLHANNDGDGILSYIFDYSRKPNYELGYYKRHLNNIEKHNAVAKMFEGKKPVGVRVFNPCNKVRNFSMPNTVLEKSFKFFNNLKLFAIGREILSHNSIPTCYYESDHPVLLFGESAKYIDINELKNGAILDIKNAQILQERGVDVGLKKATPKSFSEEYFIKENDGIGGISHKDLQEIEVSKSAEVESYFKQSNSPASYRYQNKDGLKFFVMAFNYFSFNGEYNENYLNNYYRQKQLMDAVLWLCGKPLPITITKNPNLYIIASKNEKGDTSLAISNVCLDDVCSEVATLDGEYKLKNSIGFDGEVLGNKLIINRIEPYGFTAIELEKKD